MRLDGTHIGFEADADQASVHWSWKMERSAKCVLAAQMTNDFWVRVSDAQPATLHDSKRMEIAKEDFKKNFDVKRDMTVADKVRCDCFFLLFL